MRRICFFLIVVLLCLFSSGAKVLKTNTAVVLAVGPFVSFDDGVTPETSMTVTNITMELFKETDEGSAPTRAVGVNPTASGGSNDMVHITSDVAGFYSIELTAAQLNFVGRATLSFTDADVCAPVFVPLQVVPANVFDSMIAGTDYLQGDVVQVGGSTEDIATETKQDIIDTVADGVKAKTDQLVFTTANKVDARVDYVGSNAVTTPNDFKADVSLLALEANIETHVTNSLGAYDGPTKAEMDAGFAAGAAGDPWSTSLPGAYGAGSAGYILGTNLDATVSSRSDFNSASDPVIVGTNNDKTGYALSVSGVTAVQAGIATAAALATVDGVADSILAAVQALNNLAASDVWGYVTRTLTAGGDATLAKQTEILEAVAVLPSATEVWSYPVTISNASAQEVLSKLGAWGFGNLDRSGGVYQYKQDDGTSAYFTLTITSASREYSD